MSIFRLVDSLHLVNNNRHDGALFSFVAGYYEHGDKRMKEDIEFFEDYGFNYFVRSKGVELCLGSPAPYKEWSPTSRLNAGFLPLDKQMELLGITQEKHYIAMTRIFPELRQKEIRLADLLRVVRQIVDNEAGIYDDYVQKHIEALQNRIRAEVGTCEIIRMDSVSNILLEKERHAFCERKRAEVGQIDVKNPCFMKYEYRKDPLNEWFD